MSARLLKILLLIQQHLGLKPAPNSPTVSLPSAITPPISTRSPPTATSNPSGPSALPVSISETVKSDAPPPIALTHSAPKALSTEEEIPMFAALLKALTLIPSLLPIIAAFVQQADVLLAGAAGSSKLQSVLAAVNAYIAKLETDASVIAELQKLVEPLIEGAVAFLHAPSTTAAATTAAAVVAGKAAA